METEITPNFTWAAPSPNSQIRTILHIGSRAAEDSTSADDLIHHLVSDLASSSIDDKKQATMELRLLAKNRSENRIKIARDRAIGPLIQLISSSDLQLVEYGVTTILNLSLCVENKDLIVDCGAIKPLVRALKMGTTTAKENTSCALLRLSQKNENKIAFGQSGAIPLLREEGRRVGADNGGGQRRLCWRPEKAGGPATILAMVAAEEKRR